MKKFLKVTLFVIATVIVLAITAFLIYFPRIMAGMDAKLMCSCVFVAGRTPESVMEKELSVFPGLSSAEIQINNTDSTVTAKILGRTGKAIFRKGLGCTLLSQKSESELRSQQINTAAISVAANQDSIDWPMGNRTSDVKMPGVNYEKVNEAIEGAFNDINPEKPVFTHGVIVVYNGKIIGERYAKDFDYKSRQMGWSMTKSIVNALVGILVKDGMVEINQPAPVPEWVNDERKKITVNNLLQASSGLGWNEGYFSPVSDFHKMFTLSDDKAHYAATLKLESEPGTVFEYSSGSTNILSRLVRQKVGDSIYYNFPYERLFHKIGMNTALIEVDASGTFVGSSYGWASARDWARFGLLYLNDGVWDGERILPEGWVKYSTTPAPAAKRQEYGAQIWLNAGNKQNPADCKYPGIPNEAFVFDGFEENSVVVLPSSKLVVVRLGVTHSANFDLAKLVNGVLSAIPK
jgi:CubicO group peptidase (beta-lactamase class C family)